MTVWPTELIGPAFFYVDDDDIVYIPEYNGGRIRILPGAPGRAGATVRSIARATASESIHITISKLADWINPTEAREVHLLIDKVYKSWSNNWPNSRRTDTLGLGCPTPLIVAPE